MTASRILPILALLLATSAVGDDHPVPSDPVFEALKVDGTTATGRIRQLGPDDRLVLVADGPDGEKVITLGELVKLTRQGGPTPAVPPDGPQLLFPAGDRLRARAVSAGETNLEAAAPALGDAPVAVPLDALVGGIFAAPNEPEAIEALVDRVRSEPRTADVLWLGNDDKYTGSLLGLTAQAVKFQGEGVPPDVERSRVVAFGFDPKAAQYPRPDGTYLELTLVDGSRLGISSPRVDGGALAGTTRFGAAIRVTLGELTRIHLRGASVAYLSDREPDGVVYEAYVARPREFRRDASVAGAPLRLAGQPYDHGLGTQSRTLLAYKLKEGDRRFQATIGLDDRAGPLGNVVFRVKVDGNDRFVSPPMSARDAPRAIDVDVSGSKVLILMTEFGERGEVRDYADWVEARLIR